MICISHSCLRDQAARRVLTGVLWAHRTTHPCNGIFDQWTAVDVFLTFYGCIMPPFLFSRKVVRQHTFIAWQNFKCVWIAFKCGRAQRLSRATTPPAPTEYSTLSVPACDVPVYPPAVNLLSR